MSEQDDTTSESDAPLVVPGSIGSERRRSSGADGPTHPRMAANLLMAGIVLLLVAIAAAPLIGR